MSSSGNGGGHRRRASDNMGSFDSKVKGCLSQSLMIFTIALFIVSKVWNR